MVEKFQSLYGNFECNRKFDANLFSEGLIVWIFTENGDLIVWIFTKFGDLIVWKNKKLYICILKYSYLCIFT